MPQYFYGIFRKGWAWGAIGWTQDPYQTYWYESRKDAQAGRPTGYCDLEIMRVDMQNVFPRH